MIVGKFANETLRANANSVSVKKGFATLGSDRYGLSDWDNIRISNETDKSNCSENRVAFRVQIILLLCLVVQISSAYCL